jgi:hypothetical protein
VEAEMLKEKGKVYISEIISQEAEKPRIEEISAKGAIVGEIKPSTAISEEISAKKPSFGGFFTRPGAPAGWRATAGPREKGARPWGRGRADGLEGP